MVVCLERRQFTRGLLSVNQHTNVIASCAQTFHALRVLRAHGLNKDALEGVFKAVVIAKLTYASPAWWGFTTAHDRQKMESVIRRGVRFGYCTVNQAPLAELAAVADETLFEHILRNKQHDCAPSTVAGQNAINLQPSFKKTWLLTYCKTFSNC